MWKLMMAISCKLVLCMYLSTHNVLKYTQQSADSDNTFDFIHCKYIYIYICQTNNLSPFLLSVLIKSIEDSIHPSVLLRGIHLSRTLGKFKYLNCFKVRILMALLRNSITVTFLPVDGYCHKWLLQKCT